MKLPSRTRTALGSLALIGLILLFIRGYSNPGLAARTSIATVAHARPSADTREVGAPDKAPPPAAPRSPAAGQFAYAVCGRDEPSYGKDVSEAFYNALDASRQRLQAAVKALLQEFAHSVNEIDQAVALYMQSVLATDDAHQAYFAQHAGCLENEECIAQAEKTAQKAAHGLRDHLAKLALGTLNPKVYALAFQSCQRNLDASANGACAQITARRWTQLDPDNGAAWLYLANIASEAKQKVELEDALYHVAQAAHWDLGFSTLTRFYDAGQWQNLPAFDQLELSTEQIGLSMAFSLPGYAEILKHCNTTQLKDSNRRQLCDQLANKLTTDNADLISVAIGTKVGEMLNWPTGKLRMLRDEKDALREISLDADVGKNGLGCAAVQDQRAYLDSLIRQGEIGSARQRFMHKPQLRTELAARYRARIQKLAQQPAPAGNAEKASPP